MIRLYRATENTNQRVFFDIEPCGRHLGTGGQVLLIFLSFLMPELLFFINYKTASNLFSSVNTLMVRSCNHFLIPLCLVFQDGLVHMYDLQTGNWVSGYQAASGS